jgi:hypothetical protein
MSAEFRCPSNRKAETGQVYNPARIQEDIDDLQTCQGAASTAPSSTPSAATMVQKNVNSSMPSWLGLQYGRANVTEMTVYEIQFANETFFIEN